jgi:enamine deaminase RidA (YjgF/YER057c/UK114 family)
MNAVLVNGSSYDLLWAAGMAGTCGADSYRQTRDVFGLFDQTLAGQGLTLFENAARTWVYVRDIDNNYAGMVRARREFFEAHGLTTQTRYLASTGIEGYSRGAGPLVSLDAFAYGRIRPEQMVRMEVLDHMPPTFTYGVTFERGCRIRFGDRSHLHVSGTASIDRNGNTVFPGDPRKQAIRAIENVRALLAPHRASLADLAYLAVYIRNPKDRNAVQAVLAAEIPPHVPTLFLRGAVCRPNWLVELDGVGIIPDETSYPDFI